MAKKHRPFTRRERLLFVGVVTLLSGFFSRGCFAENILSQQERSDVKKHYGQSRLSKLTIGLLAEAYNEYWVPQSELGGTAQMALGTSTAATPAIAAGALHSRLQALSPKKKASAGVGAVTTSAVGIALVVRARDKREALVQEEEKRAATLKERTALFLESATYAKIVEVIGSERAQRLAYDLAAEWDMEALVREYVDANQAKKALEILKKGREALDKALTPNIPNVDQRKIVVDALINENLKENLESEIQWGVAIDREKLPLEMDNRHRRKVLEIQNQNLLFLDTHMGEARTKIFNRNIERNQRGVISSRELLKDGD